MPHSMAKNKKKKIYTAASLEDVRMPISYIHENTCLFPTSFSTGGLYHFWCNVSVLICIDLIGSEVKHLFLC